MTDETLETLFDRSPTRELEEVQKVNEVSQAVRDIDEFYETESAQEVLTELGEIINRTGAQPRFRYVHATFGSGKTHLLKLIGIATGEIDGLEELAPDLSNQFSGFKAFREDLAASNIDHLVPIFMNLLDRDKVQGSTLSLLIYEELGNQLGYPTDPFWLLEWVWQLEIKHGLWSAVSSVEYDGMTIVDAAEDKAALRPWLYEVLPQMDETDGTPYETEKGVRESISEATDKIEADEFSPDELVERLDRTKRYLQQSGETYEFLLGLDEVAIYVGDQQHRYREFLETVETLIAEINPPILGTGQWSLRDMQRDFIGDVDPDAWYTNEIPLRGADTEIIVRKRWLRKSKDGSGTVQKLLERAPDIEPKIDETADYTDLGNPVEAYPFREHDLWLLREILQGLKKEDLEVDREYVQGRALLILVRSLFTGGQWSQETSMTPWGEREAGQIVPWDEIYDLLHWETMDVPGWAKDQIKTVENTTGEMEVRVAKVLYLIGQVDFLPNTKENITRLLVRAVETDVEQLRRDVEGALESLIQYNFVRTDEGADQQTYRFLSKEIVEFWDQVNQEATDIPTHQLRYHIANLIREADRGRLTADDSLRTRNFDGVSDVPYACRYTVLDQIEQSPELRYDGVVVRVLAVDADIITDARETWQNVNAGDQGVEDLLVTLNVSTGLQERIRHVIAMDSVLGPDADPELQIEQQQEEEAVEDEIEELLHSADIFTPDHETSRGTYINDIERVMAEEVSDKFKNRKTLETRLQEVDDARKLFEFFNGNGPWPFTAEDANVLGVKTVPRELRGGWAGEFLNDYAGEDLVSGEAVLEEIEGRRGKYLGSPKEALSALLITLAAANKIEIRRDGVRIEDIGEIGRVMRRRSDIRDIDIGFDPVDIEGSADLKSVYQSLRGFAPQGDDPTAWLTSLAEWAEANSSQIRNVCARVDIEFDEEITLDELLKSLEPGMAGGELDDEVLTESPVPTQAKWYRKAEPLFAGDTALWDDFTDALETTQSLYPDAAVTYRMEEAADGSQIPSRDRLKSLQEDAEEFRRSQVSEFYQVLTGNQPEAETVDQLCTSVEEELSERDLVEELESIRETIPGLEFESLSMLVQMSKSTESITEHDIASSGAVTEVQRLKTAQKLLEDRPSGALYTRLEEKYEQLNSDEPDEFITTQIARALRGPELVSESRAETLIEQADAVLSAGDGDDGTGENGDDESDEDDGPELSVDELWAEVTASGDGTVVVIDPTEDEE